MKPLIHAQISVKQHGGTVDDYLPIHNFIDSSKAHVADIRHRALLHSSFGCFLTEQVFGIYFTNSDGKKLSVRDIAEKHIMQDMGFIPTVDKWLGNMTIQPWMNGAYKKEHGKSKFISFEKVD